MSERDLNEYWLPLYIWLLLIGTSVLVTIFLCISHWLYLAWDIAALCFLILEICEVILVVIGTYKACRTGQHVIWSKVRKEIAIMVSYALCVSTFFYLGNIKAGIDTWSLGTNSFVNVVLTLTSFMFILVLPHVTVVTARSAYTHLRSIIREPITMPLIEEREKDVDEETKA